MKRMTIMMSPKMGAIWTKIGKKTKKKKIEWKMTYQRWWISELNASVEGTKGRREDRQRRRKP